MPQCQPLNSLCLLLLALRLGYFSGEDVVLLFWLLWSSIPKPEDKNSQELMEKFCFWDRKWWVIRRLWEVQFRLPILGFVIPDGKKGRGKGLDFLRLISHRGDCSLCLFSAHARDVTVSCINQVCSVSCVPATLSCESEMATTHPFFHTGWMTQCFKCTDFILCLGKLQKWGEAPTRHT